MPETNVIEQYKKSLKKLILLDYDGTLVGYKRLPEDATPSKRLLAGLRKLNSDPETKVIVITGRKHEDIDKFLGDLQIDIIAEHGALVKENGKWADQISDDDSWKNAIRPIIEDATSSCKGTFTEEKRFSLVWHYRNAEPAQGLICANELIKRSEGTAAQYDLKIVQGNMIIEITTGKTNKGKAIQRLLARSSFDLILCIGDDETDEDMFRYLSNYEEAITIKVGKGQSAAKYNMETSQEVLLLIEQLAS